MDYYCAFSWPNSKDGQATARKFFYGLQVRRKEFPIGKPHQVALVKGPQGRWHVGVLVLPGTSHDDSSEILEHLRSWFTECGVPEFEDYNQLPARGGTVQGTFGPGYEAFGSFEESLPVTKTAASTPATSNRSPIPVWEEDWDYVRIEKAEEGECEKTCFYCREAKTSRRKEIVVVPDTAKALAYAQSLGQDRMIFSVPQCIYCALFFWRRRRADVGLYPNVRRAIGNGWKIAK